MKNDKKTKKAEKKAEKKSAKKSKSSMKGSTFVECEGLRAGATTIHPCTCSNSYQDALYGKEKRVHNLCARNSGRPEAAGARCTVCGAKKE